MRLTSVLTMVSVLALSAPAWAETSADAAMKSSNPYVLKAQDKAVEIAKTFTPIELENLAIVKDAFGILGAVSTTDKSVESAVKQCGKDNPDMKAEMDGQYGDWKGGVITVLGTKEKELKAAINDGRFSKPREVTAFLDLLDKAAQHSYDRMEKKIVSTPKACEGLLDSMDDSADKLEKMMAELKFPYAVPKLNQDAVEQPASGAND